MKGADTTAASGKGILSFEQVPILVPRYARVLLRVPNLFIEAATTSKCLALSWKCTESRSTTKLNILLSSDSFNFLDLTEQA